MAYFIRFCGNYRDHEIVIKKTKQQKLAGSYSWGIKDTKELVDLIFSVTR